MVCPADVLTNNDLRTMSDFNNFDRFIDTTKCQVKVTMNDTVGILIQDCEDINNESENILNDSHLSDLSGLCFKHKISTVLIYFLVFLLFFL